MPTSFTAYSKSRNCSIKFASKPLGLLSVSTELIFLAPVVVRQRLSASSGTVSHRYPHALLLLHWP